MQKFSYKIAFSIIIGGLFIIVSLAALNYQNLNFTFYNVIGFLIAFIFLFGFAVGNNFALPFKKILEKANDVSKGNLKGRFYLKTKDEIEELTKIFDTIIQEFQKTKSELDALKNQSEIKLKTKTLLSEQMIRALEQKIKNRTMDLEKAMADLEVVKHQLRLKDELIRNLENRLNKSKIKNKNKKL